MKTKDIKQSVFFQAQPHEVFECLMDSKKHSEMTGDIAVISRKVGGRIKAWGDYIDGKNLELIADKKIVQEWRASDWPEGHYSKVMFSLKPSRGGTELKLTQTGIPADFAKEIAQGWKDYYWNPMKEMLEK